MANYPKQEKRTSKPTPRQSTTGKKTNHSAGVKRALKAERKADAADRQTKWEALSPQQQLADLDKHFGPGQGAKRQRERLARKIQKEQETTQAAAPPKKTTKK